MTSSSQGPPDRDTPQTDKQRKTRAIVAVAARAFAEKGYNTTSFASVARAVGLTLPGLTHYFPTKTDLLIAILRERDAAECARVDWAALGWFDVSRQLRALVARNAAAGDLTRLFTMLNTESLDPAHPAAPWFMDRSRATMDGFAALIRRAVERSEIRADAAPDRIAAEIVAMMDGLQVWAIRTPETVDMAAVFSGYLDRLDADLARDGDA